MDEVSVIKKIGYGIEGEVMLVHYKGQKACMKRGWEIGMFLEQAEVMAKLDGAGGAPRVFAACSDKAVILMEYCEGVPLDNVYASAQPDDQTRIEADVKLKVEELHRAGYCHMDIHGHNVMVCGPPGQYQVRLVDFGCAVPLFAEGQSQDWRRVDEMFADDDDDWVFRSARWDIVVMLEVLACVS